MEKIVLHADSAYMVRLDNFVRAICDTNHIGNYYATIAVPVTEAVKNAMDFDKENHGVGNVEVTSDYDAHGMLFCVRGAEGCFRSDDFVLIRMLADAVKVTDDSSTLQMSFAIRGIDCGEAAQRISVLEHFYHPTSVKVLQM
jgi:hypothetical protein